MSLATAAPAEPDGNRSQNYGRSLSHISECSSDGLSPMKAAAELQEDVSLSSGMSISEVEVDMSSRTPELSGLVLSEPELQPRRLSFSTATVTVTAAGATETRQDGHDQAPPTSALAAVPTADVDDGTYVARCVAVEEELVGADQCAGAVDSGLEDALGAVVSSLDDYRGQFPELQLLEDELKLLQVNLKVRLLQGTEPAGRAGTLDPGHVWSYALHPPHPPASSLNTHFSAK